MKMKTIFNTDPEPMIPCGAKGQWHWDGRIITSSGTNTNGEQFQRKGMWRWVNEEKQTATMTAKQIVQHYKPTTKVDDDKTVRVLNSLIAIATVIAGLAMIALMTL